MSTDLTPDVSPLDPARSAAIRHLLVAEASRSAAAPAARAPGGASRFRPVSARGVTLLAGTAAVLVVGTALAVTGALSGGSTSGEPPAQAMGVQGFAPSSTRSVATSPGECAGAVMGTPQDADGLRYLVEDPSAGALTATGTRITDCPIMPAAVAASWLELTRVQGGEHIAGALTLWGPDAAGLTPSTVPENHPLEDVTIGGSAGRLVEAEAGVAVSWSDAAGDWSVTAVGRSRDEVLAVATAYEAGGPAADVIGLLPRMQLAERSGVADDSRASAGTWWFADYREDTGSGVPLTLSIRNNESPWQAEVSTLLGEKAPADRLDVVDVGGTSVRVDGAPIRGEGATSDQWYARWQVGPGVEATLFGHIPGGLDELERQVASTVPVAADDPRVVRSGDSPSPHAA